ncbi:MAG TPA: hypothetical protein VFT93_03255, partial [Candidatus Eisenbacteria bacterium]|nr:hypothetical protein [Candidatus Eisenbacteria bacterium]
MKRRAKADSATGDLFAATEPDLFAPAEEVVAPEPAALEPAEPGVEIMAPDPRPPAPVLAPETPPARPAPRRLPGPSGPALADQDQRDLIRGALDDT